MPEPTNLMDIPMTGDVSQTEAELNAKISEELGIPEPPKVETDEEVVTNEEDKTEEETEKSPETEVEETEEEKKTEPATPSDEELFIEVEDGEGVTHKISKIEDLPDDFTPKNNRQIMEIIRETERLDREMKQREADQQTQAETNQLKEIETAQYKSWDSEAAELVKEKRLTADDTERMDQIFTFMKETNEARLKIGNNNLISSIEDALDKLEIKEAKDKATEDEKNGNALAKKKASIIGRSSAAAGGDHYVYRAGSARNIDDVPI